MWDFTVCVEEFEGCLLPEPVEHLREYLEVLDDEGGHHLPLNWIIQEINERFLDFVRVGFLAGKVKLYKLWKKGGFQDFKDFCVRGLGRNLWSIKKYVEASRVFVELTNAGFEQLPQNEAQCRPLTKFKGDQLIEKWQEVVNAMPPERQTHQAIAAIVSEIPDEKRKASVKVSPQVADEIRQRAAESGLSVDQFLRSLLELEQESENQAVSSESKTRPDEESDAPWLEDLDELFRQWELDNCPPVGKSLEPE